MSVRAPSLTLPLALPGDCDGTEKFRACECALPNTLAGQHQVIGYLLGYDAVLAIGRVGPNEITHPRGGRQQPPSGPTDRYTNVGVRGHN